MGPHDPAGVDGEGADDTPEYRGDRWTLYLSGFDAKGSAASNCESESDGGQEVDIGKWL